jgi:uncharacterized protein YkwD
MRWPGRLVAIGLVLALDACAAHDQRLAFLPAPGDAALARQVYAAVNEYRRDRRLRPLAWSDAVADQARAHSRRMAGGATSLGHRDFRKRVAAIGHVMQWNRAAENVARSRSAERAMELWLRNRGHRRNIEGRFDVTGIGAATSSNGLIYFTQIFVESR